MAETQRQELERRIRIIRKWSGEDEKSPAEIEYTFYALDELMPTKDEDLWQELKSALMENTELQKKEARAYLTQPWNLKKYKTNWWWDAKNWKAHKDVI